MLMTPVWLAALATLGGGVTPDSYATVYGTYSAGLAAVADGATFAAPLDTYRNGVWRRVNSGAADMIGAQPVAAGLELLRPTVASVAMPGAPMLDVTAADGLWAVYGLPNRAASPAQNVNLLWSAQGTDRMGTSGGAAITAQRPDSAGGTRAIRLTIPAGAVADSRARRPLDVPAGRWTLAVRVRAVGGAVGGIQLSFDGGTTRQALAPTGEWQTAAQTFHQTVTTARTVSVFHGDYPSACATAVDVDLECLWLGPGTIAEAPTAPAGGVQAGFVVRGVPDYSGRVLNISSTSVLEAVGVPASMSAWTLMISGDLQRATGTRALAAPGAAAGNAGSVGTTTSTVAGQVVHSTKWNGFSAESPSMKLLRLGAVTTAIVYTGAAIRTYVNGVHVEEEATTSGGMTTALGRIGLLGSVPASGIPALISSGQVAGVTMWSRALSASEIAAASAVAGTRAAAHALPLRTLTRVLIAEGDSISAGSGDTSPGNGYVSRAYELMTPPLPTFENRAVPGSGLSGSGNTLLARQAGLVARISELVATGITPVVTVMIGVNNAASLTTQAGVDSYVAILRSYIAALQAAGARVVVGTPLPAQGVSVPAGYDSGAMTVTGGPLSGQTFDGGRRYYSALLRHHAAGDGYWLADSDAVTAWATSAAAQAAGYYTGPDYVHPNTAGHADLGANVWLSPLSTALS